MCCGAFGDKQNKIKKKYAKNAFKINFSVCLKLFYRIQFFFAT